MRTALSTVFLGPSDPAFLARSVSKIPFSFPETIHGSTTFGQHHVPSIDMSNTLLGYNSSFQCQNQQTEQHRRSDLLRHV